MRRFLPFWSTKRINWLFDRIFFIRSDENVFMSEKRTRKIVLEEGSSAVRRFSFVNRDGAISASSRLSRERKNWRIKIAQKLCHSLSVYIMRRNAFSNFNLFIYKEIEILTINCQFIYEKKIIAKITTNILSLLFCYFIITFIRL